MIVNGVIGCLLVCWGSAIAVAAPGDGQTGAFVYALWFAGAVFGIPALQKAVKKDSSAAKRNVVSVLALIALASVGWGIYSSVTYQSKPLARSSKSM